MAQTAGAPLPQCGVTDNGLYVLRYTSPNVASVDRSTVALSKLMLGSPGVMFPVESFIWSGINPSSVAAGMGNDGYIYGIRSASEDQYDQPKKGDGSWDYSNDHRSLHVVRYGTTGAEDLGPIVEGAGVPADTVASYDPHAFANYNAAAMDPATGNLIASAARDDILGGLSMSHFLRIDVTQMPPVLVDVIDLSQPLPSRKSGDFTIDSTGTYAFGVALASSGDSTWWQVDLATGAVTTTALGAGFPSFSGAATLPDGTFAFYSNSGQITVFDASGNVLSQGTTASADSSDATRCLVPAPATVYVDDDFGGSFGDQVSFAGNPGAGCGAATATFGHDAFTSIAEALDHVQAGGTVCVAPGLYAEADGNGNNLVIEKPVSIFGAQAGIDARNRSDTGASVIIPAVANPALSYDGDAYAVVAIGTDNVTLDGFVIDGDNPAITTGLPMGAADPDVDSGIWASGSHIHVDHNVIRNLVYAGFEGYMYPASTPASQGNTLKQNWIHNIDAPSEWGLGIVVLWNYYATIEENLIDDVRIGIQTNYYFKAAPVPAEAVISSNEIHASLSGIYHNDFVDNGSPFTLADNHIFANVNTNASGLWVGLIVQGLYGDSTAIVQDNHVDGSALAGSGRERAGYRVNLITTTQASNTAITGGDVSHVDYGVLVTDGAYYAGTVDDINVSGIAFDDVALAAFYVEDTALAGTETTDYAPKITLGSGMTYTNVAQQGALAGPQATIAYAAAAPQLNTILVRGANAGHRAGEADSSGNVRHVDNALVNAGIADVATGGTVSVDAGSFGENVVVNKSITLQGPFAGTAGNDASRDGTGEAMLKPAAGVTMTISAAGANVDGMTIAGSTGGGHAITLTGANADNLVLANNRVVDVTNGSGFSAEPGSDCTADDLVFSHNLFSNIAGGGAANGRGIRLGNGFCHVQIEDNAFDGMTYAINANGGSGSVQDLGITGNQVQNTSGTAFVLTNTTRTVVNGNSIGSAAGGLFISDSMDDFTATCNDIAASGNGISTLDFFGGLANANVRIFDNAISGGSADIKNGMAQSLIVGSNWYGGTAAVLAGSNALAADPLAANPIGNAACGDNTPAQVVVYSGSGQATPISTAFGQPLIARVQDALGGAVMAPQTVSFAAPASGASASFGTASGTTNYNGTFATTVTANNLAGSYQATATSGTLTTASGFALTNSQGIGTVTWGTLSFVYDGTSPVVTATLTEDGSACVVTGTVGPNVGSYPVHAECSGTNYTATADATAHVAKASQVITDFVADPVNPTYAPGGTFTVSATGGGSGNPVLYGSSTPGVCAISGNTVTMLSAGTCVLTADQAGDANHEAAAQVTLVVVIADAPTPDLAVSIDDGRDYVQYGKLLSYTITVSNLGNADVNGATVASVLPATLSAASWTCTAAAGSACGSASGSGDLNDNNVSVAEGGSVTYVLDAVVNDDPGIGTDEIAVAATVTATGDVDASNNQRTDTTISVLFRDGFEEGGDGAQPGMARGGVLASTLAGESTLVLDVDGSTIHADRIITLARLVDSQGDALSVQALRVDGLLQVRLSGVAGGRIEFGNWAVLEPGQPQLVLGMASAGGGNQLLLMGGGMDLQARLSGGHVVLEVTARSAAGH